MALRQVNVTDASVLTDLRFQWKILTNTDTGENLIISAHDGYAITHNPSFNHVRVQPIPRDAWSLRPVNFYLFRLIKSIELPDPQPSTPGTGVGYLGPALNPDLVHIKISKYPGYGYMGPASNGRVMVMPDAPNSSPGAFRVIPSVAGYVNITTQNGAYLYNESVEEDVPWYKEVLTKVATASDFISNLGSYFLGNVTTPIDHTPPPIRLGTCAPCSSKPYEYHRQYPQAMTYSCIQVDGRQKGPWDAPAMDTYKWQPLYEKPARGLPRFV